MLSGFSGLCSSPKLGPDKGTKKDKKTNNTAKPLYSTWAFVLESALDSITAQKGYLLVVSLPMFNKAWNGQLCLA